MLFIQKNFGELLSDLRLSNLALRYWYLILAMSMVIPNWLLESYKWKCGMDKSGGISINDSIISVMNGVSLGIITPARVGEYAGRMLRVGKEKYAQSFIATFLCSISQLLVTLLVGGVTFMLTFKTFEFEGFSYDLVVYIGIAAFVFLVFAYLNLSRAISLFSRNKWVAGKLENLRDMEISRLLLMKILMLALCRYLVYTMQYILVLRFFGVDISWLLLFSHIAMIFFLQSLMPLPPVASLFARTGVALIVLGSLDIPELVNVLSSMLLWVINLTLPALVGLYFILTHKSSGV